MSAGIWAIINAKDFESGLLEIIHQGGDADSNAAVVGSLLVAKLGFGAIPKRWVEGLVYKKELDRKSNNLFSHFFW